MTMVRNPGTGRIFPCCWDDCDRTAHTEYQIRVKESDADMPGGVKTLIYIFCSESHKQMYAAGHRDYGNRADGRRTPLGLIVP